MHMQLLASALEAIANQALSIGEFDSSKLAKLEGKSLAIELAEFSAPLMLSIVEKRTEQKTEQKLLITSPNSLDENISCTIRTSIQTLVQLKNEQQLTRLIREDALIIDGDIKVAQGVMAVVESMKIDWQSELENHLGDIATYKLVRLASKVGDKLKFAKTQISSDASEWLIYEKKLAVTGYQLRDFKQDVTQVAAETDKAAQKLAALAARLAELN